MIQGFAKEVLSKLLDGEHPVLAALRHDTRTRQQQPLPGLLQDSAVLHQALAGVLLAQAVREVIEFLRKLLKH